MTQSHDHDACSAQALTATPHCSDLHTHRTEAQVSRRALLRGAGLAGAGAAALGLLPTPPAAATPPQRPTGFQPDPVSPRFTLAVMPDTQYMFDEDRGNPAPLNASLRWILENGEAQNIVFLAHLGDLTQNGLTSEFASIGNSFAVLDQTRTPYSVLAGNHDIKSSTNDQRGPTPYLAAFGPQRFTGAPTFGGASPDGYNTFHIFHAAGRDWLLLALDWRLSTAGVAWAQSVIDEHPKTPVILTTHELAYADDTGDAHLSSYGRTMWDRLTNLIRNRRWS
jgi:3',5'-cyclic AMP phosphodiesterase CpdA